MLSAIRKSVPAVGDQQGLVKTTMELRRNAANLRDEKLLIVLDQFEQWLHGNRQIEKSELAEALRQCDGGLSISTQYYVDTH